jgi:hypothetical protein
VSLRVRWTAVAAVAAVTMSLLAGAPAAAASRSEPGASPTPQTSVVKTADLSTFTPGNIVSDAVFFTSKTMSEAQIQAFLEAKVPSCEAGYTCLKDWYDTSRTTTADAMCGAYSGGTRERASRIIFKVAQACGINPQVLLVTLQKEQGLVTHVWPSDWRYTIAMGQGCPDTAACDTRYYGFFNQVYGAAWQMKRYANPPGTSQFFTWYAPGNTWDILYNPNHGCGTSPVHVQNQATANLYYYTPYQPNAAAIRAGYGEGDGCSAYGNRNFFNYFTDWFGTTQYVTTDTPFVDVSSMSESPVYNDFAQDIVWMAEAGISNGWSVGGGLREYRPSLPVVRESMAAFLYRLAGEPTFTAPEASPFVDVSTSHAFYKEIAWLASTGISAGWTTEVGVEFRPRAAVTRGVMSAFLYRFAGEPSFIAPATSPFADVSSSGPFHKEVAWLAAQGISTGWTLSDGQRVYRPADDVTRDQMSAFLNRLNGYLNSFTDVGSDRSAANFNVFSADIAWLASTGISTGWSRSDGTRVYKPLHSVKRDEMAAFMYRMAGSPEFVAPERSPFLDVPVSHVFYTEIAWLASTGITTGWAVEGGSEFRPRSSVNRDVMAAFLYRFAGQPEFVPPGSSPFIDVPVDRVFYTEIAWLASTGISAGWPTSNGQAEFRPRQSVARDVMAAFLHRLHRHMNP